MARPQPDDLPAFCGPGCNKGRGDGYGRSPVTGFWNCSACGRPTEAWWKAHKRDMEKAEAKGLCSQMLGTQAYKPRKCAGYAEHP